MEVVISHPLKNNNKKGGGHLPIPPRENSENGGGHPSLFLSLLNLTSRFLEGRMGGLSGSLLACSRELKVTSSAEVIFVDGRTGSIG